MHIQGSANTIQFQFSKKKIALSFELNTWGIATLLGILVYSWIKSNDLHLFKMGLISYALLFIPFIFLVVNFISFSLKNKYSYTRGYGFTILKKDEKLIIKKEQILKLELIKSRVPWIPTFLWQTDHLFYLRAETDEVQFSCLLTS